MRFLRDDIYLKIYYCLTFSDIVIDSVHAVLLKYLSPKGTMGHLDGNTQVVFPEAKYSLTSAFGNNGAITTASQASSDFHHGILCRGSIDVWGAYFGIVDLRWVRCEEPELHTLEIRPGTRS